MTIWRGLRDAYSGWLMILRGAAGWRDRFRLTPAGLVTALILFYLFAFLAVMLAALDMGVPSLGGFLDIMLIQSLWLLALLAGIHGARFSQRDKGSILPLLVPGIYAMIAYLVLGSLISLTIGILLPLLWLGLVWMLYRLGRVAGPWSIGVSAAFALSSVVLLVGLPMTLYMLANAFAPPA